MLHIFHISKPTHINLTSLRRTGNLTHNGKRGKALETSSSEGLAGRGRLGIGGEIVRRPVCLAQSSLPSYTLSYGEGTSAIVGWRAARALLSFFHIIIRARSKLVYGISVVGVHAVQSSSSGACSESNAGLQRVQDLRIW